MEDETPPPPGAIICRLCGGLDPKPGALELAYNTCRWCIDDMAE